MCTLLGSLRRERGSRARRRAGGAARAGRCWGGDDADATSVADPRRGHVVAVARERGLHSMHGSRRCAPAWAKTQLRSRRKRHENSPSRNVPALQVGINLSVLSRMEFRRDLIV